MNPTDVTPAKAGAQKMNPWIPASAGMTAFSLCVRLLIGGVLLYAGFLKAMAPSAEFAAVIATYKLLPSSLVTPLSLILPYVEMWVGIFFVAGLYTRQAALAAMLMFCVFLIALGTALARGIDLSSCGCFGPHNSSPKITVAMDACLMILAGLSARFLPSHPRWSLDLLLK
jgi:uncharacterized membrane protein YphA (DoxX/SURF4 family)